MVYYCYHIFVLLISDYISCFMATGKTSFIVEYMLIGKI